MVYKDRKIEHSNSGVQSCKSCRNEVKIPSGNKLWLSRH